MIKIEKTDVYGFEAAIHGMRNPLESWEKSDSWYCNEQDCMHLVKGTEPAKCDNGECGFCVGKNDLDLMKKLAMAGTDHSKYLRLINVTCDITAPLYWWKEHDQYKVGTTTNSCSTMHKIHAKEFTLDDFSHEYLLERNETRLGVTGWGLECFVAKEVLELTIDMLNRYREMFIETKEKLYWWQMIQLLPTSYNQKRTVQLNYQVLKSMYHARKNHKLDEWHDFCAWCESLPYFMEICGVK